MVTANARAWPSRLARPDVRIRPDEATWSPLEYAAHVRDVIRITHQRVLLALHKDDPLFANWDQDSTAVLDRYNEQDPVVVASQLLESAEILAAVLEAIPEDSWSRPARRSDGSSFTVETLARYFLHDLVHHLWDVRTMD